MRQSNKEEKCVEKENFGDLQMVIFKNLGEY